MASEHTDMGPAKILVVGDVMGHFNELFSKIAKINKKKGPFEALYCVGNFFGNDADDEYEDLKAGKICVPLDTYILNGNQPSFKELYEPLHVLLPKIDYLGKMGYINSATGLKIAYLSGVDIPADISDTGVDPTSRYNMHITRDLVATLIKYVGSGADILLTSQWPKYVTKYAVSLDEEKESKINDCSSSNISYLVESLKPRYHFSAMAGFYYERVPYRNNVDILEGTAPVTRFVGLAPVKNTTNQKWISAINLIPSCFLTDQQRAHSFGPTTICPYPLSKELANEIAYKNFFFEPSTPGPSTGTKRPMEGTYKNNPKRPALDASTCWFCLSNVNVEKDLIITVGDHCYITLAKGVLVPEHVFIVPINHISSCFKLCPEAFEEVKKFKLALVEYFYDKNMDVVFFERNYRSPHLQIQVVPIPKNLEKEIQNEVSSYAKDLDITQIPCLATIREVLFRESREYFYLEVIKDKAPNQKYVSFIEKSQKYFPLQLGRSILAEVLDLQHRVNWQKCINTDREKMMAEEMRKNFKNYDLP